MIYNLALGISSFGTKTVSYCEAVDIADFEEKILHMPEESLVFHSKFNHSQTG
jgi:hypothetical protein